jgi:hypothetical protein
MFVIAATDVRSGAATPCRLMVEKDAMKLAYSNTLSQKRMHDNSTSAKGCTMSKVPSLIT